MILDEIVSYKIGEVVRQKELVSENLIDKDIELFLLNRRDNNFLNNIRRSKGGSLKIIAEVKKASPSRGVIRERFDHIEIAKTYFDLNVNAISVLTDSRFFMGSLDYLKDISCEVDLPILRKDFIIDQYQIKEAALNGADAVLLIASVMDAYTLRRFIELCDKLGLYYIVEVHDENDVNKALSVFPSAIGINNRDLRTFNVDIKNTERLLSLLPDDIIVVSESGINNSNDVDYINGLKVDAVLVGEALMSAMDIKKRFCSVFGCLGKR